MGHTYNNTYALFIWHLNFIRCPAFYLASLPLVVHPGLPCWVPPKITLTTQTRTPSTMLPSTPQILPQSLSDCLLLPTSLQPPRHPLGKIPFLCPQTAPLPEGHNPSLGFATICLISGGVCSFFCSPRTWAWVSTMALNIAQVEFLFSRLKVRRQQLYSVFLLGAKKGT